MRGQRLDMVDLARPLPRALHLLVAPGGANPGSTVAKRRVISRLPRARSLCAGLLSGSRSSPGARDAIQRLARRVDAAVVRRAPEGWGGLGPVVVERRGRGLVGCLALIVFIPTASAVVREVGMEVAFGHLFELGCRVIAGIGGVEWKQFALRR
jgi:hypothetical protein